MCACAPPTPSHHARLEAFKPEMGKEKSEIYISASNDREINIPHMKLTIRFQSISQKQQLQSL